MTVYLIGSQFPLHIHIGYIAYNFLVSSKNGFRFLFFVLTRVKRDFFVKILFSRIIIVSENILAIGETKIIPIYNIYCIILNVSYVERDQRN